MTTTLWWFVQNTLTIAVLTMIAAVLCRLLRTRPAAQHAIWLVVLLKFITPPLIAWPWSPGNFADRLGWRTTTESLIPRGQPRPNEPASESGAGPTDQRSTELPSSIDSPIGVTTEAMLLDANDSEIAQRLLDYV